MPLITICVCVSHYNNNVTAIQLFSRNLLENQYNNILTNSKHIIRRPLQLQQLIRPFGNLGIGISASALALTSASASALQKIYFVLQSLYFCLSKFYMKKTSMVEYFSSTLADLPGSFRRCLEQLFCRKPVNACF